jgi:hypothetical protein
VNIQFHATREELIEFIRQGAEEFELHLAAIKEFPLDEFEGHEITVEELPAIAKNRKFGTFALSLRPINLKVSHINEFHDRNPHALVLEIGKRSGKGLKESWLFCNGGTARTKPIWDKVAKELKELTLAADHGFRYTPAAKELESRGVPMLSMAGVPMTLGKKPSRARRA